MEAGPPWTVVDLARRLGVSELTIRRSSSRGLQESSMAHLRRIRLQRAHAELRAGDPARTSVSDVALRWDSPITAGSRPLAVGDTAASGP